MAAAWGRVLAGLWYRLRKEQVMKEQEASTVPAVDDDLDRDVQLHPHIRQVDDRSLPARKVLTQQIQSRVRDDPAPAYVP
jgi:hypothetical protein